jgi:hypothetical protein
MREHFISFCHFPINQTILAGHCHSMLLMVASPSLSLHSHFPPLQTCIYFLLPSDSFICHTERTTNEGKWYINKMITQEKVTETFLSHNPFHSMYSFPVPLALPYENHSSVWQFHSPLRIFSIINKPQQHTQRGPPPGTPGGSSAHFGNHQFKL